MPQSEVRPHLATVNMTGPEGKRVPRPCDWMLRFLACGRQHNKGSNCMIAMATRKKKRECG